MNTKMYVGNLSYDSTDSDIRELFEAHGNVSDVFIVKDRESGRPAALLSYRWKPLKK